MKSSPFRFASRTNWPRELNETALLLDEGKRSGKTILDLTESNPTRCGFHYPSQEILPALAALENMRYAPCAQGSRAAREAVCAYYAKKGVSVSPEQIFLTASTSEGYSFLFRLLANPGESVFFPRPSYPLFQFLVDINDLNMQFYSFQYQEGWRVDERTLLPEGEGDVRALVVVNPNNPTGSCVRGKDTALLRAFCHKRNCALISDEVFLDYLYDPTRPMPSLAGEKTQLTFVLGGLSKSLALPQMKLSWIVINGPEDLVQEATARLEIIADTYLSVNTPVQNALSAWFEFMPAVQSEVMTRLQANRSAVEELLKGLPGWRVLSADGGWYAVLQLPAGFDEEEIIMTLLREDGIYVHPGYFFDFEDSPYLVLSLLPKTEIMAEGISRIVKRLVLCKKSF